VNIRPPAGWASPTFSARQLDGPEWRAALSRARNRLANLWERPLFDRLAREYAFGLLERTGAPVDFDAACDQAFRLFTADERAEMVQ
jgi:hypothetical protein